MVLHFEAEQIGGSLSCSDESSDVAYFTQDETASLEMSSLDRLRVSDAFAGAQSAVIRDSF